MTHSPTDGGRRLRPQDVTEAERDLLRRAFTAYNARDLDSLLALVSEDVDWPDGEQRLHGKAELNAYWAEQWTRTRTHDRVLAMGRQVDGRVVVRIERVVRSVSGDVLEDAAYDYIIRTDDSHILRLDIEQT